MTQELAAHPLATAVTEWDRRWSIDAGRADWLEPEAEVIATVTANGPITALDIGCGIGRHALALARLGCRVTALDGSSSGLDFARAQAEAEKLAIDFREGSMLALPLPDASCDYVLAWNVIYHGDRGVARQCLDEIQRVLKPGGIYQGTMLSKRNGRYGKGEEVAPNTFVIHEESDKAHPHFYCNAAELVDLFQGFEVQSLIDRPHQKPGSYHWHLVADRL